MDEDICVKGETCVETTSRPHSQCHLGASRYERPASLIVGLAKPRLGRCQTDQRCDRIEPVGSSTPCPSEDIDHSECDDRSFKSSSNNSRRGSNNSVSSSNSSSNNEYDTDLENEGRRIPRHVTPYFVRLVSFVRKYPNQSPLAPSEGGTQTYSV